MIVFHHTSYIEIPCINNMKHYVFFIFLSMFYIPPLIHATHGGALQDPIPWPMEYYLIFGGVVISIIIGVTVILLKKYKIKSKN